MASKTNRKIRVSSKKVYQAPKEILPEHKEFLSKIGDKLKNLRTDNGISASALCSELKISRNAYHMAEEGQVYFNMSKLLILLKYYSITPEDFFQNL